MMMPTIHPSNEHSKEDLVDAMLKPPEDATKKSRPEGDDTSSFSENDHVSPNEINNSGTTSRQPNNPVTSRQDDETDASQMLPPVVNCQPSPSVTMPTNHPSNENSKKNLKPRDATKNSSHEGDGYAVSVLVKQDEGESFVCSKPSLSQGSKTIPFSIGTSSFSEVDHMSPNEITIGTTRPEQGNNPMAFGQDYKPLQNGTANASQKPPPNSHSFLRCYEEKTVTNLKDFQDKRLLDDSLVDPMQHITSQMENLTLEAELKVSKKLKVAPNYHSTSENKEENFPVSETVRKLKGEFTGESKDETENRRALLHKTADPLSDATSVLRADDKSLFSPSLSMHEKDGCRKLPREFTDFQAQKQEVEIESECTKLHPSHSISLEVSHQRCDSLSNDAEQFEHSKKQCTFISTSVIESQQKYNVEQLTENDHLQKELNTLSSDKDQFLDETDVERSNQTIREGEEKIKNVSRKVNEGQKKNTSLEVMSLPTELKNIEESICKKVSELIEEKLMTYLDQVVCCINTLQTENDGLQNELSTLRSEKEKVSTSYVELTQQLQRSKQECTSLSTSLKEYKQNSDNRQRTVNTLKQPANLLQTENDRLQNELSTVRSEKEKVSTSYVELTQKLEHSEQECTFISTSLKEYKQNSENLQHTVNLLQTKSDRLQVELREKDDFLDAVIISFENQVKRMDRTIREGEEKLKDISQKVDAEQKKNKELEGKVARLNTELKNVQEWNSKTVSELFEEGTKAMAYLHRVICSNNTLQTENDHLLIELSTVRFEKDEQHEKEIADLKKSFNCKIKAIEKGEADKVNILECELKAAKLELIQTEELYKRERDSYKEDAKKHQADFEKLQKKVTDANGYNSDLERQINENSEMMKELQKRIRDLSEKVLRMKTENRQMRIQNRKIKIKLTKERAAKEHLAKRFAHLQSKVLVLETENHNMKIDLEEQRTRVATVNNELTKEQDAKERLAKRVVFLNSQLSPPSRGCKRKIDNLKQPSKRQRTN